MSRIRTIKPEFWTSEQVIACSSLARLLFIGLWNFCDDSGIHPASYLRIKAEVFPIDDIAVDEIKRLIVELINNNLLHEYTVDDKSYWLVTGWKQHQRIEKPTYRHPLPLSGLKKITDYSASTLGELNDSSATIPRLLDECSTTDGNGKEGNGKDKDIREVETSHVDVSDMQVIANTKVLFEYWQQKLNHPYAKFDEKRKAKIQQALKTGYIVAELKQAIDGCAMTPYNMGESDSGQKFDDISLIFRDAEHIERFIRNAKNPPISPTKVDAMNQTTQGAIL